MISQSLLLSESLFQTAFLPFDPLAASGTQVVSGLSNLKQVKLFRLNSLAENLPYSCLLK